MTDLNIWCVTRYVPIEETSAITTIHVAHLSVKLTIGAFLESASFTSLIILFNELSCDVFVAFISKVEYWFIVPLNTSSPTYLSTGSDSPFIIDSSIEPWPFIITPSTGIVSPAITLTISPISISSAFIIISLLSLIILACFGVSFTRISIPDCAFWTVKSSSRAPIVIITEISPAANISPIITDAINAKDTKTSALISNSSYKQVAASFIIGKPQSIIATHDKLKCKSSSTLWIRLINKQIDEIIINVTVFCISDLNNFIMNPPFYSYTHGGIWKLKKY